MPISEQEKRWRQKGEKKIHTHCSFIAQAKPFQLQPWSRSMGCQDKALIHPPLGEGDSSTSPEISSEVLSAWGYLDVQVQALNYSQRYQHVHNGSKGRSCSLTCVLRAYGLCYLSPIHAVLLIRNNPPSGATPRARKKHKQINRGNEKKTRQVKCPSFSFGGDKLVKCSHSCHWFFSKALMSLGKTEGW